MSLLGVAIQWLLLNGIIHVVGINGFFVAIGHFVAIEWDNDGVIMGFGSIQRFQWFRFQCTIMG